MIGGLIGYDFLPFYTGGYFYWKDIDLLYSLPALARLQNQIIGIPETGVAAFLNPPYVGLVYGILSFLPYTTAFILWTLVSIACLLLAAVVIFKYLLPEDLKKQGLSLGLLIIVIFSFYPTFSGLQLGQNHAHSLLLVALIVVLTKAKRPYLTGLAAGLLLYKPQMLIGWILVWLLTKNFRTLFSLSVTGAVWVSLSVLHKGISPYFDYLQFMRENSLIVALGHLHDVTPIASFSRLFYILRGSILPVSVSVGVMLVLASGLWLLRRYPGQSDRYLPMLAILFPMLCSPHFMQYDLLVVVPLFVLWAANSRSVRLLYAVIFVYFSVLILFSVSEFVNFPVMGIIPLFLLFHILKDMFAGQPKPA